MTQDAEPPFKTEPAWAPLGDLRASTEVRADAGETWIVTLSISRAPDAAPVDAQQVQAELRGSDDSPLPLIERLPGGPEVGEAMRIVTAIMFRFGRGRNTPAALSVTYHGQTARFVVTSGH